MFYLDHCRTAILDQIKVLWHYQSEVDELDYEFILNHALSIYQFSDHIRNIVGLLDHSYAIRPMEGSDLVSVDHCKRALREQIQMLWTYQNDATELDYDFIRTHALYIMQFSEQLKRAKDHAEA